MSDHDNHEEHEHEHGAHEVDKMPSSRLFNLLFGLSALTLVACIGVVQLFYRQVDTILDTRNAKVSFQLAEYRQEMDELKKGWVAVDMTDDDGLPGKGLHEDRRTQMPLEEARKRVLEQSATYFKAQAPYAGWTNPDPNAPKAVPRGAMPTGRVPQKRPVRLPAQPGGLPNGLSPEDVQKIQRGLVPPTQAPAAPAAPTDGKAPAAPAEGKAPAAPAPAEGKAPAKGEGKAEGKAPEGKAEGKAAE